MALWQSDAPGSRLARTCQRRTHGYRSEVSEVVDFRRQRRLGSEGSEGVVRGSSAIDGGVWERTTMRRRYSKAARVGSGRAEQARHMDGADARDAEGLGARLASSGLHLTFLYVNPRIN